MYKVCANVNDVMIQSVPLTPDMDLWVNEVRFVVCERGERWRGGGEGGNRASSFVQESMRYDGCATSLAFSFVLFPFFPVRDDYFSNKPSSSASSLPPPPPHTHVNQMLRAATPRTKLMFVCTPGNPTSKSIPLSDILDLASSSSYRGLVIVDEAYVDFGTTESAISLVARGYDNVVVLQTLSKAFGLAGIRCGFAIGPPDVIRLMNNVKAPYNMNKLTSDAARNALRNTSILEENVAKLLRERDIVARRLEELDFVTKVYHSDANFLLFRVRQRANELYKIVSMVELFSHVCIRSA